jgi:hypothetical protein
LDADSSIGVRSLVLDGVRRLVLVGVRKLVLDGEKQKSKSGSTQENEDLGTRRTRIHMQSWKLKWKQSRDRVRGSLKDRVLMSE